MTRPRVAYLACPTTLPGSLIRREDAFEHDLTMGLLGKGLHFAGRTLEAVSWDDPQADWSSYEAAIIGTTWDYVQRLPEFLDALQRIATQTRLMNPPELVSWNAQKRYLRDMAERGCATIPTLWLDAPDEAACRAAYEAFNCEALVIKPEVGAGAWRQVKLRRGDLWPEAAALPPGATMVQPFMPSVVTEGEYSFLFFDRQYSHCVVKQAAQGDYRIQSSYGGQDRPWTPSAADLMLAQRALEAVDGTLLYARVDMVRGSDGALLLMELELIEPYLYPLYANDLPSHFAQAYVHVLQKY
jgi:hypothetical protein